jgi:23S rRNA pseudouridine2605 synthase
LERLQKIIARAGISSRRAAEQLITSGRVQVNGKIISELGAKADAERDHIRVDGKLIHAAQSKEKQYFLLNKPKGYVTTVSDPEGRPTVMDLVHRAGIRARVYPVGRLDWSSEGLLLLTNDGELANQLMRAASHVPKTYFVKISGKPSKEQIAKLRAGVVIGGETRTGAELAPVRTAPAKIRLAQDASNPWYEVVLTEGRNRQLHRMFQKIGHHVEKIKRVAYGPLRLDVEPGIVRRLSAREISSLQRAVQQTTPSRAEKSRAS